ncbi:MAG: Gfo/Idh/MocA family protein [Armatimonadota bacterium]
MRTDPIPGCAVIGVGAMGSKHARVWAELPSTRLMAVYDVDPKRAVQVAEELGCDVAGSLEEVVKRGDVDIVSVCTPDTLHVEPCVAAARAGKHVLVEKPLATTVADADAIIGAAAEAGVRLMVGHILRFDARYVGAREQVAQGALGELVYAFARRYNVLSSGRHAAAYTTVMNFLGVHDIDALQWVTGARITQVFGVAARKLLADRNADDAITAVLKFDNEACGCLESLWCNPDSLVSALDARLELVGTAGRVAVNAGHWDLQVSGAEATHGTDVVYGPLMHGEIGGALRAQLEHFARCVVRGCEQVVDNEGARQAVAVAEAIHHSLELGRPVDVE